MTNKKVRTWLIFFVKLLPLILLIGFMLYFFRHELPQSEDVVGDTYNIGYEYYSWDELVYHLAQTNDSLSNSDFLFNLKIDFNVVDFSFLQYFSDDVNQIHYIFLRFFDIIDNSSGDEFSYGLLLDELEYGSNSYFLSCVKLDGSFEVFSGLCSYSVIYDSVEPLNSYFDYIVPSSIDYNDLSLEDLSYYMECPFIKEVKTYTLYDYDHSNYFDNIVKQFDDFTKSNFNFIDSLNFNDFYDFTVEHLVHNPSPIYHSVFNIMIYEIIVDLMLLLFGAFVFVINWSRKWLEGIYEKW